jgi:hypothetical protein
VARQGSVAPRDHGAGRTCRSLYALALVFPPKLADTQIGGGKVSPARRAALPSTAAPPFSTRSRSRARAPLLRNVHGGDGGDDVHAPAASKHGWGKGLASRGRFLV